MQRGRPTTRAPLPPGGGLAAVEEEDKGRNGYSRLHGHSVDNTFAMLMLARQLSFVCAEEGRIDLRTAWDVPLAGFEWAVPPPPPRPAGAVEELEKALRLESH